MREIDINLFIAVSNVNHQELVQAISQGGNVNAVSDDNVVCDDYNFTMGESLLNFAFHKYLRLLLRFGEEAAHPMLVIITTLIESQADIFQEDLNGLSFNNLAYSLTESKLHDLIDHFQEQKKLSLLLHDDQDTNEFFL